MLWAVFFLHALWAVPSVEAYLPGESFKQRFVTFVKTFDWLGGVLTLFGTGMLAAGITYVRIVPSVLGRLTKHVSFAVSARPMGGNPPSLSA